MSAQIDWEKAWTFGIDEMNRLSTTSYWNRRAEDYSDMVLASNCNHGRKILELFEREKLLKKEWNVLDIASGPGAITIPFAEHVCKVTAVEPAEKMAAALMSYAQNKGLSNVEVIPQPWQEIDVETYAKQYDLVICCHALWQFPDILPQIRRMEAVSRGYCCLAHSFEPPAEQLKIKKTLKIEESSFDQFLTLLNLLNDSKVHPNVDVLDYTLTRSATSAISWIKNFVEKYRPVETKDIEHIQEYVQNHAVKDMYQVNGKMGVFWWKVDEEECSMRRNVA